MKHNNDKQETEIRNGVKKPCWLFFQLFHCHRPWWLNKTNQTLEAFASESGACCDGLFNELIRSSKLLLYVLVFKNKKKEAP